LGQVEILTPPQVAARLNIPLSAVYEKTRSRSGNPLPVHKIGKYLRFKSDEVLTWFDGQLRTGTQKKRKYVRRKKSKANPQAAAA